MGISSFESGPETDLPRPEEVRTAKVLKNGALHLCWANLPALVSNELPKLSKLGFLLLTEACSMAMLKLGAVHLSEMAAIAGFPGVKKQSDSLLLFLTIFRPCLVSFLAKRWCRFPDFPSGFRPTTSSFQRSAMMT